MLALGGIAPNGGALNWVNFRHCDAPTLLRRRNAVLWEFMGLAWQGCCRGWELEAQHEAQREGMRDSGVSMAASSWRLGSGGIGAKRFGPGSTPRILILGWEHSPASPLDPFQQRNPLPWFSVHFFGPSVHLFPLRQTETSRGLALPVPNQPT